MKATHCFRAERGGSLPDPFCDSVSKAEGMLAPHPELGGNLTEDILYRTPLKYIAGNRIQQHYINHHRRKIL